MAGRVAAAHSDGAEVTTGINFERTGETAYSGQRTEARPCCQPHWVDLCHLTKSSVRTDRPEASPPSCQRLATGGVAPWKADCASVFRHQPYDKSSKWLIQHHGDSMLRLAKVERIARGAPRRPTSCSRASCRTVCWRSA